MVGTRAVVNVLYMLNDISSGMTLNVAVSMPWMIFCVFR